MNYNCIIIDDEKGSHVVLGEYLKKLNNLQVTGRFFNVMEAYHFLKENVVHIILLDINMPEADGFMLLDMLDERPAVIFTTAYSDYALKSYEYNAADYLHKPIRFERFVKAVEKAIKWLKLSPAKQHPGVVELKINGYLQKVFTEDILYVESLGNYLAVVTVPKKHIIHMTMTEMEALLPKELFVRTHKSYLVNAACISKLQDDHITVNGTLLPIGKTYKMYFREFYRTFGGQR